jgi:hypothetical protein
MMYSGECKSRSAFDGGVLSIRQGNKYRSGQLTRVGVKTKSSKRKRLTVRISSLNAA